MYKEKAVLIPKDKREFVNKTILDLIRSRKTEQNNLSREDIFNSYTGKGGLHGLNIKDFYSFAEYTAEKKNIEQGQFFTPHHICKEIIDIIKPDEDDKIVDLTSGMGNFCNYVPDKNNFYGCDIDFDAIMVARFLYPEAKFQPVDVLNYDPYVKFNIALLNPPFNLRWRNPDYKSWDENSKEKVLSQFYCITKAAEMLHPGGVMAIITPDSFLRDDFMYQKKRAEINDLFSFLGQYKLKDSAFKGSGVDNFATKVMFFVKRSAEIDKFIHVTPYAKDDYSSSDKIFEERINRYYEFKNAIRGKLILTREKSGSKLYENDAHIIYLCTEAGSLPIYLKDLLSKIAFFPLGTESFSPVVNRFFNSSMVKQKSAIGVFSGFGSFISLASIGAASTLVDFSIESNLLIRLSK